jgi:hypothetical protein
MKYSVKIKVWDDDDILVREAILTGPCDPVEGDSLASLWRFTTVELTEFLKNLSTMHSFSPSPRMFRAPHGDGL